MQAIRNTPRYMSVSVETEHTQDEQEESGDDAEKESMIGVENEDVQENLVSKKDTVV